MNTRQTDFSIMRSILTQPPALTEQRAVAATTTTTATATATTATATAATTTATNRDSTKAIKETQLHDNPLRLLSAIAQMPNEINSSERSIVELNPKEVEIVTGFSKSISNNTHANPQNPAVITVRTTPEAGTSTASSTINDIEDPVEQLEAYCSQARLTRPKYEEEQALGPLPGQILYTISVTVNRNVARAKSESKNLARTAAAALMITKLKKKNQCDCSECQQWTQTGNASSASSTPPPPSYEEWERRRASITPMPSSSRGTQVEFIPPTIYLDTDVSDRRMARQRDLDTTWELEKICTRFRLEPPVFFEIRRVKMARGPRYTLKLHVATIVTTGTGLTEYDARQNAAETALKKVYQLTIGYILAGQPLI